MKFDSMDNPQIRPEGVNVGPASQLPISHVAPGRDIAEGAVALGGAVGKLGETYRAEKAKADGLAADDRELKFARDVGDLLYNKDTGFLNQQGEAALDTSGLHEKIEELRQKYAGDLQSEAARQKYEMKTALRVERYREAIETHAAKARDSVYESTAEGTMDQAVADVGLVWNKPDRIEEIMAAAYPTVVGYLKDQKKLPVEKIKTVVATWEAKVYSQALKGYESQHDYKGALAYLDTIRPALGAAANEWEKRLKDADKEAEQERVGLAIWNDVRAYATNEVSGRFNERAARDAFETGFDPEQRAIAEKFVEAQINKYKGMQNEDDRQRVSRLAMMIRETGYLDKTSDDYKNLDDEGRNAAQALLDQHNQRLKNDAATRRVQASLNRTAVKDFLGLPPAERAKMSDGDLASRYGDVDEEGFASLRKARMDAITSIGKGSEVTAGAFHSRVQAIAKTLPKDDQGMFVETLNAWFASETKNGVQPDDDKVTLALGKKLLMFDRTFSAFRPTLYGYKVPDPSKFTALPADQQKYPEAKEYLKTLSDPYAALRAKLMPGEILVRRNGKVGAIQASKKKSSDEEIK